MADHSLNSKLMINMHRSISTHTNFIIIFIVNVFNKMNIEIQLVSKAKVLKGIFWLVGVCKHICFTSFWKLWEHDAVSRISFGSSQCFKKQIKMHNYLICIYMVFQYRLFLLNAFHINISYFIMITRHESNS